MTRTTNARIAGFTFLFYIAVAFPSMVLLERATSGEGIAAKLASIAQHAADVRVAVVLSLLGCFSALVLAVTLYAITREVDADLAMLALTCRVAEGVISGVSIPETLDALARHGHGSKCTGPRGSARARRVPSEGGHGRHRNLLRSGQHALLLPLLARPDDPRRAGLARRAGIGSACRGASAADRRRPSRLHHATHVFTDARVRSAARAVAARQGSRPASNSMSPRGKQSTLKGSGQRVGGTPMKVAV